MSAMAAASSASVLGSGLTTYEIDHSVSLNRSHVHTGSAIGHLYCRGSLLLFGVFEVFEGLGGQTMSRGMAVWWHAEVRACAKSRMVLSKLSCSALTYHDHITATL